MRLLLSMQSRARHESAQTGLRGRSPGGKMSGLDLPTRPEIEVVLRQALSVLAVVEEPLSA